MRGILPLRIGTPMQPGASSDGVSLSALARRQYVQQDNGDYVWFWYTTAGIIVKYTIFFTFLVLLLGWVVGGRIHAKRRLKKGLKPLPYHAWLLSRHERAQVDPAFAYPQPVYRPVYGNNGPGGPGGGEYYTMYPMPPPVYDPNRPPVYDAPPVGSKVDPIQERGQAQAQTQGQAPAAPMQGDYAPPAGPPPAR